MKQFVKYVLATITGLAIMSVLGFILFFVFLGAMASQSTVNVKNNSVLVLKMDGILQERSNEGSLQALYAKFSSADKSLSLENVLSAIEKAKDDDNIKGIYIEAGALSAAPASLQAIHNALKDFRKKGKFIISYGDVYTQGCYYLASTSNEIILNPSGEINWIGMASTPYYLKDFFEKIGVGVQIVKVGKYKSATEMFSETHMSDANREQVNAYLTSIWKQIKNDVAANRKISADSLDVYADRGMVFMGAEGFKKNKMVDKIAYSESVKESIKKQMKLGKDDDYNTISLAEYSEVNSNIPKDKSGNIVAVYYACGEISDISNNTGESEIVGRKVCDDLDKLAKNEDVKAVVLRVNSPGGSAYASEQIWHHVMLLKEKKPVVVSMGDYAASGGYYISCGADYIVAEPTTITGSIGIFGVFINYEDLANNKLGIHFDSEKTNKYADMLGSGVRRFNEDELGLLQNYINRGYDLFLTRCANGRKKTKEQIHEIAQGRVWTGVDGKKIGIVDELGGLQKAIEIAAKRGKVKEYTTVSYPTPPSFFDSLLEDKTDSYADTKLRETFGNMYDIVKEAQKYTKANQIQARIPYRLNLNL